MDDETDDWQELQHKEDGTFIFTPETDLIIFGNFGNVSVTTDNKALVSTLQVEGELDSLFTYTTPTYAKVEVKGKRTQTDQSNVPNLTFKIKPETEVAAGQIDINHLTITTGAQICQIHGTIHTLEVNDGGEKRMSGGVRSSDVALGQATPIDYKPGEPTTITAQSLRLSGEYDKVSIEYQPTALVTSITADGGTFTMQNKQFGNRQSATIKNTPDSRSNSELLIHAMTDTEIVLDKATIKKLTLSEGVVIHVKESSIWGINMTE